METSKNENTMIQNLWDTVKTLRKKYIVIQAYLKKEERSQINNLNLDLKEIGKKFKKKKQTQSQQIEVNNKDQSKNK